MLWQSALNMPLSQDPCFHYVCIYYKEYAQTATTEADNKRTIHESIFLKVLCIRDYTLLFSTLCPMRWNVVNYH